MNKTRRIVWLAAAFAGGIAGPFTDCPIASAQEAPAEEKPAPAIATEAQRNEDERRQFQSQELITAKPYTWIISQGEPPRIVWRDVEAVRSLGFDGRLRVRWFDAKLDEAPTPKGSGRWLAWIEGLAPNGTPLRRALTFYVLPKDFLFQSAPELSVSMTFADGSPSSEVWREHQNEISRLANDVLMRAFIDSQNGAILMAAFSEWKPLGRPAEVVDSAAVLNEDYHLALKLKVQGMRDKVRPLEPPRRRETAAAILHEGSLAEAGMIPDAKAKIEAVCRDWAADAGEPMVTLIARRGVIVVHQAFGKDSAGKPVTLDYRCDVASITKSVTALLFSRFLDQGLIELDDPVGEYFPDYPRGNLHVPTFRQCFNHTSGLSGHGEFGGCRNPHLENVILNGIDVNQPGVKYSYSGMGFDLAMKAMEIVAGQSAVRLYEEHLFRPLGLGDVPLDGAASGAQLTAMELGILAQWIVNQGSYGELEFISPSTFQMLLPEPITVPDRGSIEDEGIGLHWIRHLKAGAPPNSKSPEHLLFSPRTIGHGSFTGCVFVIDPDGQLVITQVRRQSGPRSEKWSPRFFQTIAEALVKDGTRRP